MIRPICLIFILSGLSALDTQKSLSGIPQANTRLQALAKSANLPFPLQKPEIHVYKAAHRLELWASGVRLKTYKVGLGHRGLADKVKSGDHLTPEGEFFVCTRNAYSQFHLFLGISYPNKPAAERGLKAGLITRSQYDHILRSTQRRQCPPWDTSLGGTVGIHGCGSSSDWTWGCAALNNGEMDELWAACPMGTPIYIKP